MATETFVVDSKTGKATIVKDDDAVLDYTFDWTSWLDLVGDFIATASVPVIDPTGGAGALALDLTAPHTSGFVIVGKTVVVWLKDGLPSTTYRVTCRIVTVGAASGARTDERSVYIKIKER